MIAFPLVRTKQSNEHIMAELFIVLLLYLLPLWIEKPSSLINFLAILAFGLFIDVFINFIRYKKPICAVSAAVTAAILDILTPGVPLWGKLMGLDLHLLLENIYGAVRGKIFLTLQLQVFYFYP